MPMIDFRQRHLLTKYVVQFASAIMGFGKVKAAVGVPKFPTELQYAINISGKSRPMTF